MPGCAVLWWLTGQAIRVGWAVSHCCPLWTLLVGEHLASTTCLRERSGESFTGWTKECCTGCPLSLDPPAFDLDPEMSDLDPAAFGLDPETSDLDPPALAVKSSATNTTHNQVIATGKSFADHRQFTDTPHFTLPKNTCLYLRVPSVLPDLSCRMTSVAGVHRWQQVCWAAISTSHPATQNLHTEPHHTSSSTLWQWTVMLSGPSWTAILLSHEVKCIPGQYRNRTTTAATATTSSTSTVWLIVVMQ